MIFWSDSYLHISSVFWTNCLLKSWLNCLNNIEKHALHVFVHLLNFIFHTSEATFLLNNRLFLLSLVRNNLLDFIRHLFRLLIFLLFNKCLLFFQIFFFLLNILHLLYLFFNNFFPFFFSLFLCFLLLLHKPDLFLFYLFLSFLFSYFLLSLLLFTLFFYFVFFFFYHFSFVQITCVTQYRFQRSNVICCCCFDFVFVFFLFDFFFGIDFLILF